MKTNSKALKLIEMGLSANTVGKLSESQLELLYGKFMLDEQTKTGILKVPANSPQEKEAQQKKQIYIAYEGEMSEDEVDPMDVFKGQVTQAPHQVGASTDMDDPSGSVDGMPTEGELEEKKKEYNPWAICTSTLGKEFGTTERSDWSKTQMAKYERFVKEVKKSIKEGRNPYESLLENQIMKLVNKHVNENMNMVSFKKLDKPIGKMYSSKKSSPMEAAEPAVKPRTAPPKTKPGVKPSKPNPYQPPKETPKEKPRAQDYKSMFISALNQLLGK